MLDYILLSFLFFLGTLTKLVFFPLYLFRTGTTFNKSLQSMNSRVIYYLYVVTNYLLSFVLGSYLVANCYAVAFVFLWLFLIALDIAVFVVFYNKSGNLLGSPVAFIILLREILFALISMVLIGIYFTADCEQQMVVYGGIIWGFAAAKIMDAFPKFYVFDKHSDSITKITSSTKTCHTTVIKTKPTKALADSLMNAVNVCILALMGAMTGFLGSTDWGSFVAVLYCLYVAGYLVYVKFN